MFNTTDSCRNLTSCCFEVTVSVSYDREVDGLDLDLYETILTDYRWLIRCRGYMKEIGGLGTVDGLDMGVGVGVVGAV